MICLLFLNEDKRWGKNTLGQHTNIVFIPESLKKKKEKEKEKEEEEERREKKDEEGERVHMIYDILKIRYTKKK